MVKELLPLHFHMGGMRTTIVAVINPGRDWACYIGATSEKAHSKEGAAKIVSERGDKLSEEVAKAFFPNVLEFYRK